MSLNSSSYTALGGLALAGFWTSAWAAPSEELWRPAYQAWAGAVAGSSQASMEPAEDPDSDHLTNFQEFVLGTRPDEATVESEYQSFRVVRAGGDKPAMLYTYQRRADWEHLGLTCRVMASEDLRNWRELEEAVHTSSNRDPETDAGLEEVSHLVTASGSSEKLFIRLLVGSVEVARGAATWPATLFAREIGGLTGFTIRGAYVQDALGGVVTDAGDVNGDGIDDIGVGALWAGALRGLRRSGESYVIFGRNGGFPDELGVEDLDGTNGFALLGEFREDLSGIIASAGDVNGDGVDDIIIGAYHSDASGGGARRDTGAAYVVFGRTTGFPAAIPLGSLNGTNGFVLRGVNRYDRTGISVGSAGDINGDGVDDIAIGADIANRESFSSSGDLYIVYGRNTGFPAVFELDTLDGTNGFRVTGSMDYDFLGRDVAAAGDLNGDGVDDLIIGTSNRRTDWESTTTEDFYVLFGNAAGFPPVFSTTELDGTNGFTIRVQFRINFYSGAHVAGNGDVNGDGIPDIVIGNDQDGSNPLIAGAVYVVFGSNEPFPSVVEMSAFADGTRGTILRGIDPYDYAGSDVAIIGDLNGDGIDEILVGAMRADGDDGDANPNVNLVDSGEAYVIFGRTNFGPEHRISDFLNGVDGFLIPGANTGDLFGRSVSRLGDVNGDGGADFIIGAHNADRDTNADEVEESVNTGEAVVIFGLGVAVEEGETEEE